MSFKSLVFVLVILIATALAGFTAGRYSIAPRITEDDPQWDCRTMGNKICGPGARQ